VAHGHGVFAIKCPVFTKSGDDCPWEYSLSASNDIKYILLHLSIDVSVRHASKIHCISKYGHTD
jgi:hypothetical protein